jgi:hypothetical protein
MTTARPAQLRIAQQFDRRVERVHVEMGDEPGHDRTVRAYSISRKRARRRNVRDCLPQNPRMSSASPAASIRFATRADALVIAEMSRDYIEYGLGWSWTRERILRSLRHRDTNAIVAVREADRAGFAIMKYGDDEAHLLLLAVEADAPPPRRRQRDGRVARALCRGRRRRPHHSRGAREQRRRARVLSPPRLRAGAAPARLLRRPRDERADGQGVRHVADRSAVTRAGAPRCSRCRLRALQPLAQDAPIAVAPLPLATKRVRGERRRVRRLAPRAELRALGRAPRRERVRRAPPRGTIFDAGHAEADRGRDARRRELGADRRRTAIALRWRPASSRSAASPGVAISRGPVHPAALARRRRVVRVGFYQTVWLRDRARRRLARPLRRQRVDAQTMESRGRARRALGRRAGRCRDWRAS